MGFLATVKGLFKPGVVKEIYGGAWGDLVNTYGLTVDTLTEHIRCVEKPGVEKGMKVMSLRIFSLPDVEKKGLTVTGWETFDQHPELILFEGYVDSNNRPFLQKRSLQKTD